MADTDGVVPPAQESDGGAKTVNQNAVEAARNGIDSAILNIAQAGGGGHKVGARKQKNSKSKSNMKDIARAKTNTLRTKPGHADDSSTASSSDTDTGNESGSQSSVAERKQRKKSQHRRQTRTNHEGHGRQKLKSSRKVIKRRQKSGKGEAEDSSDSPSTTSDSESDSESLVDTLDSQQQSGDNENASSQRQIKELQAQVQMLQSMITSPPLYNPHQYGYIPQPQTQLNGFTQLPGLGPASGLNPPPGLFPPLGSSQMYGAPPAQSRNASAPQAGSNSPAQGNRLGRRRTQQNPDGAVIESPTVAGKSNDGLQRKVEKPRNESRPDFKRVDWVWDTTNYTYKLQDSVEASSTTQYDGYVFHVRRIFDPDGKYRKTSIDIKSKLLRECLQDVMGNPKGVSLVDETPKLDPNLLFLYLSDFRDLVKLLKKTEPIGNSKKARKKDRTRLDDKRKHLKVLVKYLDADYDKIKSSLDPMLKNGLITFDLLWALWKPDTIAYGTTYGNPDMPRIFKVEAAERHATMHKGEFYYLDGRYFEFDGKRFGYGQIFEEILEFKGARKITSLPCYPLSYCANEEEVRQKLITRGQKFVALSGMNYKAYNGMAFMRRKKAIIRFNITNSRIMVDPATFRRSNPNYYVSQLRSRESDMFGIDESSADDDDDEDDDEKKHGGTDSSDDGSGANQLIPRTVRDLGGNLRFIQKRSNQITDPANGKQPLATLSQEGTSNVSAAGDGESGDGAISGKGQKKDDGAVGSEQKEDITPIDKTIPEQTGDSQGDSDSSLAEIKSQLTAQDFLLASPVVLGFSFSEKQWLEFSVDSVMDIKWNDKAWDSLVLEAETKHLIRALVESRKYNPATTIDDVIQGKGKGLVAVLHGPPGTGKTLTAEGISELLKCPLYMASAGELGTDSRFLEHELQKILDICHTWGAILLLDEADVFLEKRNMQDIHRNALVSIFLRQLEYFQGILFLTTNRVETFDEAFQSRIHVALRYDKLDLNAKKAIFKLFIERVKAHGRMEIEEFRESDLSTLARQDLNGREIKNVMGSAQDLALNKKEPLGIKHIRQVLDVHAKFGRDLKGGPGYEEALNHYT